MHTDDADQSQSLLKAVLTIKKWSCLINRGYIVLRMHIVDYLKFEKIEGNNAISAAKVQQEAAEFFPR